MKKFLLILFCPLGLFAQYKVNTYAGAPVAGYVNGDTATARFNQPFGICSYKDIVNDIVLFIADGSNHRIRVIDGGIVGIYAGTGIAGFLDGSPLSAQFNNPTGVCYANGVLYIADFQNHRIRKIKGGTVTTVAGTGVAGYQDGPGNTAKFSYPRSITIDKQGNLYVGDSWNHRIRKIAPDGTVSTFAGGGSAMGVSSVGSWKDGADTSARFYTPCGVAADANGNIFVADAYNHRIRKISPNGMVTTLAGGGISGTSGGGDLDGQDVNARLHTPTEVYADSSDGSIYVGDTFNNKVRKVSSAGFVSTVAGAITAGYVDGDGANARFNYTRGVTKMKNTLYVVDYNNNCIRAIRPYSPVGVDKNSHADFSFSPNPAKGKIKIIGASDQKIEIFHITGKSMGEYILNENDEFDISHLISGMYFIRSGEVIKKLIVE